MGGEQAATVLATITKGQKEREGKEVCISLHNSTLPGNLSQWKNIVNLSLPLTKKKH